MGGIHPTFTSRRHRFHLQFLFWYFGVSPRTTLRCYDYEDFQRSAAVYNVSEDEWKLLPEMSQERDEFYGAFIHGKFFVISGCNTVLGDRFELSAEVYDPVTGAWTVVEGKGPQSCVVEGKGWGICGPSLKGKAHSHVWLLILPGACIRSRNPYKDVVQRGVTRFLFAVMLREMVRFAICLTLCSTKCTAGQGETIGKWTAIEKPENSHVDYVQRIQSAITFEI